MWASLRRYQVRQGLAWSLLAAALGLVALAAADYRLELPWNVRAAGLVALSAVVLAVLVDPGHLAACGGGPSRGPPPRSRVAFPSLASESEPSSSMPGSPTELIHSEGVTPSLVDALEEETEIQAQPLPLDRVVPWRRVWARRGDGGGARARPLDRRGGAIPSGGSRAARSLAEPPAVYDARGRAGESHGRAG